MTTFGGFGNGARRIRNYIAAWSWWTLPRAVSSGGVVYVGVTNSVGQVVVLEFDRPDSFRTANVISNLSGELDDHNNPAIILESGRPPIIVYARHSQESQLRYRIGVNDHAPGAPLGELAAEQTVALNGRASYACAHVHQTGIYVLTRRWPTGFGTTGWTVVKSTDWGQTWSDTDIIDEAKQIYVASRLVGSTIRLAITTHPLNGDYEDQNIYYGEINLTTGDIVSGGTTIANLDGTNLPLAMDDFEIAYEAGENERTWVYDVSAGDAPEIVMSLYDSTSDFVTSSEYHYLSKTPMWTSTYLAAAGGSFEQTSEPYFGGCQFDIDGSIIMSRLASGVWRIERWTNADGWAATTTLFTQNATGERAAVRPWPVTVIDDVEAPFDVVVNWAKEFDTYFTWKGSVGPVPMN